MYNFVQLQACFTLRQLQCDIYIQFLCRSLFRKYLIRRTTIRDEHCCGDQEPVLWIVAGYANLPQLFWLAI